MNIDACDGRCVGRTGTDLPGRLAAVLGGGIVRVLRAAIDLRPREAQALAWAWLYIFTLFLAYYVMRPIRDEMGLAGGVRQLPWLFSGTLLAMVVVNPLFAYAVRRWPRERFIAVTYRFFMAHLLGFVVLLAASPDDLQVWIGRAFFIWVSVFNLFVVSVFWSIVVDVFDDTQGRRLFGILAAGATLGGIAGSSVTAGLAEWLGQNRLLLVSIALLEVSVFAAKRLSRWSDVSERPTRAPDRAGAVGGGVFAGLTHTLRSPYLIGISLFMVIYAVTSTVLYFQQAEIVGASFPDRGARTAFFATIDLWVNVLTLVCQVFLTGYLVRRLGVVAVLCVLAFVSAAGFTALAIAPTVGVLVVIQVARRVSNFAFARPTREVLFTSLTREDRYKAKTFIDTVIYRGGDQIGSWSYAGLIALGLGITGVAWAAVPLSVAWLALSVWLGLRHATASRRQGVGSFF